LGGSLNRCSSGKASAIKTGRAAHAMIASVNAPHPPGPAQRALDLIEARLFEPLNVSAIADAVGLSPFHFSRLFTARMGESVMAYVWRRRIEHAAETIARTPDVKLIELALECGFDSQEAFTRAFKRAFGVAPGQFKRSQFALRPQSEIAMPHAPADITGRLTQRAQLETRPAFRVAGLVGEFTLETRANIPLLWDKLLPHFAHSTNGTSYGVCWDASPGAPFKYMAAIEIAMDGAAPAALETKIVPAQTYLVFDQAITPAPLHPQMSAATSEIWDRLLPASGKKASGGPDFEFYPPTFRPNTETRVSYYVPVAV
jgi:AraC family transcriptional regulator